MDKKQTFTSALRKLLRPLVKLMLEYGISFSEMKQLMEDLFVEVAEDDFQIEGKKQTESRLAILTGIHRKEVKKIKERRDSETTERNSKANIVTNWRKDPLFCDENGEAKVLPKEGDESFATLVKKYSGDVPVMAALNELIRLGICAEEDGNVILLKSGFIPNRLGTERVKLFAEHSHDFLNTMAFNLTQNHKHTRYEKSCSNNNISQASIKKIQKHLQSHGDTLLHQIDAYLDDFDTKQHPELIEDTLAEGVSQSSDQRRVGIGIYYFEEEIDPKNS